MEIDNLEGNNNDIKIIETGTYYGPQTEEYAFNRAKDTFKNEIQNSRGTSIEMDNVQFILESRGTNPEIMSELKGLSPAIWARLLTDSFDFKIYFKKNDLNFITSWVEGWKAGQQYLISENMVVVDSDYIKNVNLPLLHLAVWYGKYDIVKLLLDKGADATVLVKGRLTALYCVIFSNIVPYYIFRNI